jgi:hypothetical protein
LDEHPVSILSDRSTTSSSGESSAGLAGPGPHANISELRSSRDENQPNGVYNLWKERMGACIAEMREKGKLRAESGHPDPSSSDDRSLSSESLSQTSDYDSDPESQVSISTDAYTNSINIQEVTRAVFKEHYSLNTLPDVNFQNDCYSCANEECPGSISVNQQSEKRIKFSGFQTPDQGSSKSGTLNPNLVAALLFLKQCAESTEKIDFKTVTFGKKEMQELNSGMYNDYLDWHDNRSSRIQILNLNLNPSLQQALSHL